MGGASVVSFEISRGAKDVLICDSELHLAGSRFTRTYAHQVGWRPCNVDVLRRACELFVGTMDYAAFCNASRDKAKNEGQNTTRTIYRLSVVGRRSAPTTD